jgi:hypothetical protein
MGRPFTSYTEDPIMTPKKSVHFTATLAVVGSLIATSAHAGLLGGGSGGLGGGFGGGLTPRSLDVGGNAAGHVRREPMTLPRGDKAKDAAGNATAQAKDKVNDAAAQGATKAHDAKATAGTGADAAQRTGSDNTSAAPQRTRSLAAQAEGMVAIDTGVSRQAADKPATDAPSGAPTTAPTTTPTDTSGAKPATSSSVQGGAAAATRRGGASAGGSAQASREDRRLSADGSANASMQR